MKVHHVCVVHLITGGEHQLDEFEQHGRGRDVPLAINLQAQSSPS